MKREKKLIIILLLVITAACMFLPIARFEAVDAEGQVGATLDYSLLPGRLPEALELDLRVVYAYMLYNADFEGYHFILWAALALIALTIAALLLAGKRSVSKFYTLAAFSNLFVIVLLGYALLRLRAFPFREPWSPARIDPLIAAVMLACPIAALAMNMLNVIGSKRSIVYVLCAILAAISILPFWIMIVNATRSTQQIQQSVSLIPSRHLAENWSVLQGTGFKLLTGLRNSAIISFGSTILCVYLSALTAYGLTVYNFKGRNFAVAVVYAIIMIPCQVTATGFYILMYRLNLVNSYISLIIPSVATAATVFFFRQYLKVNLQTSLIEAARIDGASEFLAYNTIAMPVMVPAIISIGITTMITNWNSYLMPLMLLQNPGMKTLPMMVMELRGGIYSTGSGSIYLGLTLTALPLIVVYFAFSKHIIAGLAAGGVKE